MISTLAFFFGEFMQTDLKHKKKLGLSIFFLVKKQIALQLHVYANIQGYAYQSLPVASHTSSIRTNI